MSRGLGRIERRILEVLDFYRQQHSQYYEHTTGGGLPISELQYCVYYSNDYWDKCNDMKYYSETHGKLTESQQQSIWIAVRRLEKKGLVKTYRKPHSLWTTNRIRRGGSTCSKIVKLLVQSKISMNYNLTKEA